MTMCNHGYANTLLCSRCNPPVFPFTQVTVNVPFKGAHYEPESDAPATVDVGPHTLSQKARDIIMKSDGTNPDHATIDWPKHYNQGKIQMTDYVVDQKLGWCSGNIIKYVIRSRLKGKRLEDLKKARWYLNKLIDIIEKGGEE